MKVSEISSDEELMNIAIWLYLKLKEPRLTHVSDRRTLFMQARNFSLRLVKGSLNIERLADFACATFGHQHWTLIYEDHAQIRRS